MIIARVGFELACANNLIFLFQQLSSGGVDPFLGSSNPNFHQRDPSLDSGVGMGNNYNIHRSEEYLTNVEEMDTGITQYFDKLNTFGKITRLMLLRC